MEFKFSYLTAKNVINIDDEYINIKVGVIKTKIKKSNLKYVYIKAYQDYNHLILRYENEKGKLKNKKILFAHGEQQAIAAADYLVENTNCKDLRNVDEKEAMSFLKTTDAEKAGFLIAFVSIILVITIFLLPSFIHLFDNGLQTVDVSQLINNEKLSTHNVIVKNGYLLDGMYAETTSRRRHGGTSTTTEYYFPLVDKNWDKTQPIKVMVKTGKISQTEIDALFDAPEIKGVLENVMWEGGMDDDNVEFLNNEYGYIISDDIVILATGGKNYVISLIIYIVIILIIAGALLYVKIKRKN